MASLVRNMIACLVALVLVSVQAAPKINYADVRTHMSHAFQERAHEMSATLAVLQGVSKATMARIEAVQAKCGTAAE